MGTSPASSAHAHTGPLYLGRYELVGELARGGMGTVYLARHAGEAGFQRLFAIKVLHPHLAEEKEFVDMLADEARIAARIHHPNVVSVLDMGTQDDLRYVVMEYVEGPAFSTLLKRNRENIRPELVVSVVIDALEGLHAAHTLLDDDGVELHLVHRDVSPQNILVGTDGAGCITDFGIAKAETRMTNTQPGTRKGKLQFMSPEQITGSIPVDARTDIWAAGALLWGALTEIHLFRGENEAATVHNVLMKEVLPPSTQGAKPPAAFDEVILRALDRDPDKRFASALEMADALRAVAASSGLLGVKQKVARWVAESFADDLERRRKAIREVAARRANPNETPVNWLAPLPAITSSTSASGDVSSSPGAGSDSGAAAKSVVKPTEWLVPISNAPTAVTALESELGRSFFRRRIVWAGLATVAVVASALVFGLRGKTPPDANAAREAPSAAPTASAQAPATGSPSAQEQSAQAEGEQDTARDDAGAMAKALRLLPPTRRAPGSVRPVLGEPAKEGTRVEPKEAPAKPAPAPSPLPTPAPVEDFEKNPYLRR